MIEVGVQALLADRYQLQERLGRGAMGEVWRAADQLLGRPVAVKLLCAEDAADAERFRLEAQTAGRLNHPNVVGMYDFGSHQGRLYLVMELVEGWSLAQDRSLRGVLAPQDAAAVVAQVAAGLAAAHRQGVVHRDVKPANVMLTGDRTAKVADFGIARFADEAAGSLTVTGKILGTADYLAPERALGRPAQPASDVYSLGCVLYELLTGRPPFRGATSLAVVQQHVDAVPPPPVRLRPGTPQPLSDYVLRLLAKDPAHRPTAQQAADWLAACHRTPLPAQPGGGPATLPARPFAHAPGPQPRASRDAAHSRPRGRRGLATRATLCGVGLALFTAAAALGASIDSGDPTPSSPSSPAPATLTSPPAPRTPPPTVTAPPARRRGDDRGHERKAERNAGKARGPHSHH
ncbi:serine/threonine-protein kinase [Streptomyces sp. NPDC001852]|uniref:serine/threonine-protein kinase n=1 Tax=Streptomyces sp. NPDC001852 TaxID=3364619 RepID=UPI0036C6B468